jgi:hypothetical protein
MSLGLNGHASARAGRIEKGAARAEPVEVTRARYRQDRITTLFVTESAPARQQTRFRDEMGAHHGQAAFIPHASSELVTPPTNSRSFQTRACEGDLSNSTQAE